jgi:hypothetical protein
LRLQQLGEHPQIPKLWDYLEDRTGQYLIQEWIAGPTLETLLLQDGPFSETAIQALLKALLPVLEYIHSFRVIHRDIKPQNIIQPPAGRPPVLVDFGASKVAPRQALAQTGTVIGSAEYVAPEQTMGKAVFASDLYSLGVTCLHLLTGTHPFELYSVSEDRWVWRDYLPQPVSERLGRVLDQLVARSLRQRYQTADQALFDLQSARLPWSGLTRSPQPTRLPLTSSLAWDRRYRITEPMGIPHALAVSLDGLVIASGSADGTIYLWELATGALRHTFGRRRGLLGQGHGDQISVLQFHPDGQTLYSASYDGTIKEWDLVENSLRHTLPKQGWIPADLALTPDGRWLISAGGEGHITLWDIASLTPKLTLTQHQDWVSALDISADGQRLASAGWDCTIRLWQLPAGRLLQTFKAHDDRINALVLHPTGEHVISGGQDGQVKVWHLGPPLTCDTLYTAPDSITALALSPDARWLAVGTEGNVLTVWRGTTGDCISRLAHGWGVVEIAFAPDGKTLITSSRDETVSVWQLSPA